MTGVLVELMEADFLAFASRWKQGDRTGDEGQLQVAFPIGARGHEFYSEMNAAIVNGCGTPGVANPSGKGSDRES